MIAYFGEVVKMCANISYLIMTLNRYMLIGKDHAPWLISIAKLEFKWVIRGSILVSALLNIGHIWEYEPIDWVFSPFLNIENTNYKNQDYTSYTDYPIPNYGQTFFYYTVVYFVINCAVFFVVNTSIEVKIVRRLHKEIKEKRARIAQMNHKTSSSTAATLSTNQQDNRKIEEDEKKERRVIKMVIVNGTFNFFLRLPDIFVLFENESVWRLFDNNLTFVAGLFNLFDDIGYFTYILTFSTNFLVFYNFNSKFKEAVIFFPVKRKL
jgi:hypothetical protein